MSFVGKILVVVQLVLSVLFMALAGAVFATHQNWKVKYEKQAILLEGEKKNVAATNAELDSVKQAKQKTIDDAKVQVDALTFEVGQKETELVALRKKNNEDQQELQTQTSLADTKAKEAIFRTTESEEQRAANRALQASLDETAAKLRAVEDEKFALSVEFDNLKELYSSGLVKMAYYERMLRLRKIETDPKIAQKLEEPPPPVEGLVKVTKKDRTDRPKYVEITVGEDDGLLVGHVMDVVRTGVGGQAPQYLGKVRIISIEPDSAVGEVVESAKNGIIEVGDNVTTKL